MKKAPILRVHPDSAALARSLAAELSGLAQDAIRQRGCANIALSGGSTPEALYRELGEDPGFPWEDTRFFLVDERFVPSTHPDWNAGMIRRALARPDINFYPIDTDNPLDADLSARYYQDVLTQALALEPGELPVFDLVLLGMGKDGHTASLFPGTGAVDEAGRTVIAVTPLEAPHERVSLSLPVLLAARRRIFLLTGKDKGPTLRQVLEKSDKELPASLLAHHNPPAEFWMDQALGDTLA